MGQRINCLSQFLAEVAGARKKFTALLFRTLFPAGTCSNSFNCHAEDGQNYKRFRYHPPLAVCFCLYLAQHRQQVMHFLNSSGKRKQAHATAKVRLPSRCWGVLSLLACSQSTYQSVLSKCSTAGRKTLAKVEWRP